MEKLLDTLDTLGRPRILLVGDLMLDEFVYGDAERMSPEAPVPVLRVVRRELRLGGAANVASAVVALGGTVRVVGVLGDDEPGRKALAMLAELGADTSGIVRLADRPTTLKRRYVGLAQHRHQQQILRVDEESADPLDESTRDQLVQRVREALGDCDVLALEDYGKGVLDEATAPAMIAEARKADTPAIVDPVRRADYARYRNATLLTPNRYEAELASGVTIDSESAKAAAAETILAATQADAVAITLDREGAYLQCAGQTGLAVPTRPRSVYDVSGAGDVVMATLAVAIGGQVDLPRAVALANVAGGLEVERFGVVPVTREELHDELRAMIGLRRSKIMPPDRLAGELERQRRRGASVVFTNGCFDLLHMGHVGYLQQAREQGSLLVVAINSDDSVQRLKGPARPVISQAERAEMLASLECVDYVTIFADDTPEALLQQLRPDILVKGGSTDVIVGREIVEGYGGQVRRLDLVDGLSTTTIINRILEAPHAP